MCLTVATTSESSRRQAVATNSSSWKFEGLEKAMALSQSSETIQIVNVLPTEGLADRTTWSSCVVCKDKSGVRSSHKG